VAQTVPHTVVPPTFRAIQIVELLIVSKIAGAVYIKEGLLHFRNCHGIYEVFAHRSLGVWVLGRGTPQFQVTERSEGHDLSKYK
jgi:hypothetical protein